MAIKIKGQFDEDVFLQLEIPKDIDISENNYSAESIEFEPGKKKIFPFIVCEDKPVTLKIETWSGVIKSHRFTAGPYPMPLRRIFSDAGNVYTESDDAVTTIQISY